LGAFGLLCVCYGGCPVACCFPPVLVRVTDSGHRCSLMLQGGTLMGLGCPAEGADTGDNRLLGGSPRVNQMTLR
jgi:hypothetical protein